MILSSFPHGSVWDSPRFDPLSSSGPVHGIRALTSHSQHKGPSLNTAERSHGILLLFAPAESSVSHFPYRISHVAVLGGFRAPLAVAETNLGSLRVSSLRAEKNLSGSRVPLASAETRPGRLRAPSIRAETDYGRSRVSSAMSETKPSSSKTEYGSSAGDNNESGNVSVWDSNAEGIRRSWRTSRTSSGNSGPAEERPRAKWDDVSDAENSWQWWRTGPDDDAYEGDTDDDEEDSFFSWFNLDNFDVLSAISMLRWMLPAAAIFLPWLFGGPMFLMMGFAFFPLAQKLLGLLVPGAWKAVLQGGNTSSSKSKKKQRKRPRVSTSRGRSSSSSEINEEGYPDFWARFWARTKYNQSGISDDFYGSDNEEWTQALIRNLDDQGQTSKLGGWDDFDEDFWILRRGSKNTALERRRKRKEMPLILRLVVALFPFLRSWGGFL